MDNLTHSLVGAALGQAGLKRRTGLAMPALVIGANIPDVDAACFFWLEGTEHLGFRRGITHGPLAMLLLPLLLAGLLWSLDRWQAQRGTRPQDRLPVSFKWLYLLSLIGCLSHPALDWLNVYGIRLLEPISSRWFYGDILFIIDVWLWALLGFAVWFSRRREKRGGEWMRPARIALVLALAYIAANGAITAAAERSYRAAFGQGPELIASPVPIAFWEREGLIGEGHFWTEVVRLQPDDDRLRAEALVKTFCAWPDAAQLATGGSRAEAFLLWARAPFAEPAPDGSVILRDARFYGPQARDQFAVFLPEVKCVPMAG